MATNVATPITITGAVDAGNDLVWINGVMYEMNGSTLYAVNLSTHVATSATVPSVTGTFGAAWSDAENDLFFSDNSTGNIYEITNYTTGSPVGTLLPVGEP